MMPKDALMMFTRLILFVIILTAILIMLTACGTVSQGSNFCDIYKPVYTSNEDTEETVSQVVDNNALWLELCSDN